MHLLCIVAYESCTAMHTQLIAKQTTFEGEEKKVIVLGSREEMSPCQFNPYKICQLQYWDALST